MAETFSFEIVARDGDARRGLLRTPHGVVETPAFMPVATFGAVRGLGPADLADLGAEILLANAYHLHERPGEATVERLGGLHGFTGWAGPWLTDSGGFQVTSLGSRVRVEEDGVTFRSPLDGVRRKLTPEGVIGIQEALGSDIAMVLDECLPVGEDESAARTAMERTLRWAERAARARRRPGQAVFGIVQGGAFPALRRESARRTAELGFDGHAHGGLGLGEDPERRLDLIAAANEALPPEAPRYLMGLGRPEDLVRAIAAGVELFDCVIPTRNGRHGLLFTREGVLAVRNARFRDDPRPPDPTCGCPACRTHSRAYLRHLLHVGEALGARLATLHNLRHYLDLMAEARRAISEGRLASLAAQVREAAHRRL